MIISHRYKYVFFELPMTGSTAIAAELEAFYDGKQLLAKHSSPKDFMKIASEEEKKYFMFSGIRNPLDQIVSHYYKYKSDHKQNYSGKAKPRKFGMLRRLLNRSKNKSRYNFIVKNNASFQEYFERYYKLPYSNWSLEWHSQMDYIIRFEELDAGFATVLQKLGIEAKRPLPKENQTSNKKGDFWEHYPSDSLQRRAVNIFGVFMKKWEYALPSEWAVKEPSVFSKLLFPIVHGLKSIYWKVLS